MRSASCTRDHYDIAQYIQLTYLIHEHCKVFAEKFSPDHGCLPTLTTELTCSGSRRSSDHEHLLSGPSLSTCQGHKLCRIQCPITVLSLSYVSLNQVIRIIFRSVQVPTSYFRSRSPHAAGGIGGGGGWGNRQLSIARRKHFSVCYPPFHMPIWEAT